MIIDVNDRMSPVILEGSISLQKNPIKIKNILSIIVHSNEGDDIPHFHIKRDGVHDCCIMLNHNQYFSHSANNSILSGKEEKELDEWLRLPNKTKLGKSNFRVLCDMWNDAIANRKKALGERDFNYTNIKPYKE